MALFEPVTQAKVCVMKRTPPTIADVGVIRGTVGGREPFRRAAGYGNDHGHVRPGEKWMVRRRIADDLPERAAIHRGQKWALRSMRTALPVDGLHQGGCVVLTCHSRTDVSVWKKRVQCRGLQDIAFFHHDHLATDVLRGERQ